MSRIKVEVTSEDILLGKRGDMESCMVARAVLRHVSEGVRVVVDGDGVRIGPYGHHNYHLVSRNVQRNIRRFDGYRKVEPFKFILDIPDKYLS